MLITLNLLALLLHTVQEITNPVYQSLRQALGARKTFFDDLRALTRYLLFDLAWVLPELWGEARLPMLLPSLWVFPPYVLIMIFLGGGQEELGWRGYILDFMEERLGQWWGNLILGIVWAVWHLPLFFIPGASQMFMPFAGFLLLTIGYSWFFAWVRETSGKRTLAGLVTHGWANAFIPLFPTLVMADGAVQTRYWIWVSLTFVIGLVTMMLRSRQPKAQLTTD